MQTIDIIARALGYVVGCAAIVVVCVVALGMYLRERMDQRKNETKDLEARMSVRFAGLNKDMEALHHAVQDLVKAQASLRESIQMMDIRIDAITPGDGYENPSFEQEHPQEGDNAA